MGERRGLKKKGGENRGRKERMVLEMEKGRGVIMVRFWKLNPQSIFPSFSFIV